MAFSNSHQQTNFWNFFSWNIDEETFFFFFRVLENLSQFFKWLLNWRERERKWVCECASVCEYGCVRVCASVYAWDKERETECGKKSPKKTLAIRDPDISAYDLNWIFFGGTRRRKRGWTPGLHTIKLVGLVITNLCRLPCYNYTSNRSITYRMDAYGILDKFELLKYQTFANQSYFEKLRPFPSLIINL